MARLPPYSTFRTDKSQLMVPQAVSKGNVLKFTPRGFNQVLNVKFPDSRLAVCEKCKKNYKTRESCRVRSGHTTPPWTTCYICVTLDDSCTDEEGNYVDKPLTVRMLNWQPFSLKKDFESNTPVCASCKKTNRTRSFCRDRHKHRQLPWCTVYVILSAVDTTDPSTVVAAPSKLTEKTDDNEGKTASIWKAAEETNKSNEIEKPAEDAKKIKIEEEDGSKDSDTDDIYQIEPSRTFLSQISCKANTIHWLELMEGGQVNFTGPTNSESEVKALNDAIRNPTAINNTMQPPPAAMPAQPYYPVMNMQQHQQYFQQQQEQFAAWQAQYGQPVMMPMMPLPPMVPPSGHPVEMKEGECEEGEDKHKDIDSNAAVGQQMPVSPASPDAHAQWQAQMMFQQQIYHQHFFAHQQYMAQQAMMAQQGPVDPNCLDDPKDVHGEKDDGGNGMDVLNGKFEDDFGDENPAKRLRLDDNDDQHQDNFKEDDELSPFDSV